MVIWRKVEHKAERKASYGHDITYVIPKKQLNQARGIGHFIGGWYEYNEIKNIFLLGAREGKYESPSVDW